MTHIETPGFIHYPAGAIALTVVTDGVVHYDSDCFAPGIPREAVQQVLQERPVAANGFALTHNILVIKSDSRIILIDAGNGHQAAPAAGRLPVHLMQAGIHPDTVTDIVITHAHPDHINGLIGAGDQLVFPQARVHLSQTEYDFWLSPSPDFSRSKNSPDVWLTVQQEVTKILAACAGQLQLFTGTTPLFDVLEPISAPGHTPGHYMFAIANGDKPFIHIADIVHEAVLLFSRPDWGTIFDTDFAQAAATREQVLGDLARTGQRVFGYHLPWPGFGHVQQTATGYQWVPETTR
ncbi:MBL fold metallo-hydrolase [Chitinophaga nivalis]|uniref:MBL fold metallo-hydrolase n=1 Tax=Chitinophaga nivalis TaxID=2991709 RepID=A0ABT3IKG1_9BACT|nr:MBL fold metallo-hydrolase [Chitinophaga nivalis]MCW3465858.1 MBL fold metallo-hydrolase [Chitinophaga nivalis]MCW3484451.1 MBL fold metallo-hydrolase [Chitinophaga nivalis]